MDKQRHRETGTYWQEQDRRGQYALHVNGHPRGIADTNTNEGVILTAQGEQKFTAPDTKVIFDEVERRVDVPRVDDFRSRTGLSLEELPLRSRAEQRAQDFQARILPGRETEYHARAAKRLLDEKPERLSHEETHAHMWLGKALTAIKKSGGRVSYEAERHLESARHLLRDAPTGPEREFGDTALNQCEKAVAAIDPTKQQDHAEQEVLKALDILEAKRGAPWGGPTEPNPGNISAQEMNAGERLFDALIHMREVAEVWDKKSRGLVKEARDHLREHYRDPRNAGASKDDLHHCENAVKAIERNRFAGKIKAGLQKVTERGRDQGRERE